MANDVTLRQLRYFAAAARTGRFSMAAADEHVSQSAVTNAVLALEAQLGVRLFDRHPHGVTLTPEGHNFHQRARDVLDSLDDALREPGFQRYALRGSVRIAASYTVLGYFLPDLLARFRRRYPDVVLDLVDLDRPEIEKAVASGDVELGVALLSNVDKRERFGHQVLVRSRRQLWTASGHPLLQAAAPSLTDIAKYPYILLEMDEGRTIHAELLAGARPAARHRVSHPFDGGAARTGGARLRDHDAVGHGVPPLVPGRPQDRGRTHHRRRATHGSRPAVASARGHGQARRRVPAVHDLCLRRLRPAPATPAPRPCGA